MTPQPETPEQPASFEDLALPHMQDLFRTATSILGSRAEGEDVVQEAYLQAWKSFHRFTPGTNCRAWLFKILFHVISHHRRKWLSRLIFWEPADFEDIPAADLPVGVRLTEQGILSAFRMIPEQFANVVMLADVHEFTYKEIQETLGIPIGTVMSRLSRGRQLLRSHLGDRAPVSSVGSRGAHTASA